ncbi:MAG: alpha/beta hydrolase [bacterium]|nr:alpha/beta hydrolase [bacterium]
MTNPVALATTVWGDGSRRALLLHGLTSAASTWWRTGEALAGMGFTVVAPDLRGHGASPAGDCLSIEAMRDDVLLLGNGWDLLVGHSLGGAIAAAALAAYPDFARRSVLEDPAIDSGVTARFLDDLPEPLQNPTVAAIAAQNPTWHPYDVELKLEALLACGPKVADRVMQDAAPWDVWSEIVLSAQPTLVIGADPMLGSLVSEDKAIEMRTHRGSVRFARIPGAGHSMHRDTFDQFIELVRGFVVE